MTVAAAAAAPTHTPVCWTATDVLLAPTGVFGLNIQKNTSSEVQRDEAVSFLTFLKMDPKDIGTLALTAKPIPLLIKVPGTYRVKFILGLAPCFGDPFAGQPSPMHGALLAIDGDIDNVLESPTIRRFPDMLRNIKIVQCPAQETFLTKMEEHRQGGNGTKWFKVHSLAADDKEELDLAMVAPFPPYLAYNALTAEIDAHVLYDRLEISALKQEAPQVGAYAKNFLRGVHIKHTSTVLPLNMGTSLFIKR